MKLNDLAWMWLLDVTDRINPNRMRPSSPAPIQYLASQPQAYLRTKTASTQTKRSRINGGSRGLVPITQTKHSRQNSERPSTATNHHASQRFGLDNRDPSSSVLGNSIK